MKKSRDTSPGKPAVKPERYAPYRFDGDSLLLSIWLKPKAGRCRWRGVRGGFILIEVEAPAIEGRANEALLAYLADCFELPRRSIVFLQGEKARQKRVLLRAPRSDLEKSLQRWLNIQEPESGL